MTLTYLEKQILATGRVLGTARRLINENPILAHQHLQTYYNTYRKILSGNQRGSLIEVSDALAEGIELDLSQKLKENGDLN
ncbi:hypothetical protein HY448_02590 [Candidatus Pacearchaeota archaeon]|nr:hypothetical protein [Candidatus Pacearchaeota archaeon]